MTTQQPTSFKKELSHANIPAEIVQEKSASKLIQGLNQVLADVIDLKLQAKQAHWNIKAPHFLSLHELFDQVATEADDHTDTIGERIVQLGGVAQGAVQTVSSKSSLKPYPNTHQTWEEHLYILHTAIIVVCNDAHHALKEAEEDVVTADILTGMLRGLDKLNWFIRSHFSS